MAVIHTKRLACGMPLIVETIDNVRSAALSWLIPAGIMDEPEHLQGMGAMWSELLMRGCGTLDSRAFADAMDRIGATRGVDASSYFTRVGCTLMGDRVVDALPILVDMVRAPRMEESAIEPTRDLALQSLESLKDDPQERAMLAARLRHHPAPLNRSGLGTEAGLKAITRADLADTWKRLAVPGRGVFAAAGAVDPGSLATQLDRLLQGWSGANPEPRISPTTLRGYGHEPGEGNQVQIVVVHDAPPEKNLESVIEKVVISVLSGGMSGRLFTEVREKRGLCYSVSAGYRGDRDYGVVTAYVGTTPERAQESLDVLFAELERIQSPAGKVEKDEFDRARIGMKSRLVFSGESTAARAGALAGDWHRLGRARSLDEMAAQIDAVTLDQVNDYLAKRSMGRVTVQTLGPAELKWGK